MQARTIGAVNDGRVPARYQEELVASVNELVASITCAPPPEEEEEEEDDDDDEDDGPGKGKSKGKKRGRS